MCTITFGFNDRKITQVSRIESFPSIPSRSIPPCRSCLFTSLSPLSAKRFWLVINLLLLGFSGYLLHRMTALGRMPVSILILLTVGPLESHFLFGQLHILVLVLLLLSLWLYLKDWPIVSGLMLALAAALKIYPIFFVFYYIRKKQWRVVAGLIGGVVVLSALAVWLFGLEVNMAYVLQVLPRIMHGESIDPYNLNWSSFTAVFHRLFLFEPELNPHPFKCFLSPMRCCRR